MKLRVFVIDDEISIRETIQWHLESQGHQVITAAEALLCDIYNGCDCSKPYLCGDILFIDQWLPKMTGLEFIKRMQERGCNGEPSRKFIISGDTKSIDMDEVSRMGCNVIQKPVRLNEIDKVVEEVVKATDPDRKLNDFNGLFDKTA